MKVPHLLAKTTHDLPEEGQLVVYDSKGERLVVLNEMGAAIYFLIDGQNSVSDIVAEVRVSFPGGAAESCDQDVEEFLERLVKEGVVTWEAPESSASQPDR